MASDFEHLCSHIAIAQTSDRRSLVKDLVVQTFVSLAPYTPSDQAEIATDLKTLFSVPLDEIEIRSAIDQLTDDQVLQRTSCGTFAIRTEIAADVKTRIDGAHQLQAQLHAVWNSFVSKNFPDLAHLDTFSILKTFFFSMFRRHGIQAAGLLHPPLVQAPGQAENSLTADLGSILHTDVPPQHRAQMREALLAFLRPSLEQPIILPQYISRLSNAAYNFYSLQAPPEVAMVLRGHLEPLVVFLDTNFLMGILDLHVSSQVQLSKELISACHGHNVPFRFRYLDVTRREFVNTVAYYGKRILHKRWSQSVSRAAVRAGSLSGIELRYHQQNAETPTPPDVFLGKYEHFEHMLKDRGIDIFRHDDQVGAQYSSLFPRYKAFLERRGREKMDESINHDATVLQTLYDLRTASEALLGSGYLLLTCDFQLHRFALDQTRERKRPSNVLLPYQFWELLRPYVGNDEGFDRAFAAAFSLPEFQSIDAEFNRACSRALGIISTYREMPEELAAGILTNRLLIEKMRGNPDEAEAERLIDAAIVEESRKLIEDRDAAREAAEQAARRADGQARQFANLEDRLKDVAVQLQQAKERERENERAIREGREHVREVEERERRRMAELQETTAAAVRELQQREAMNRRAFAVLVAIVTIAVFEVWLRLFPIGIPASAVDKAWILEVCWVVTIVCLYLAWNMKSNRWAPLGLAVGGVLTIMTLVWQG